MSKDVNHIHLNPNFVQESLDRSIVPTEHLLSLIEIDAERWKLVQDSAVNMATGRLLDNAEGINLDNIGNSLGLPRTSADDEQYRQAIKLRSYSRNINFDEDSLIDIISRYTGVPPEEIIEYKAYKKGVEFQIITPFLTPEALTELVRLFPALTDVSFIQKDTLPTLKMGSLRGGVPIEPDWDYGHGLDTSNISASTENVGTFSAALYTKELPK